MSVVDERQKGGYVADWMRSEACRFDGSDNESSEKSSCTGSSLVCQFVLMNADVHAALLLERGAEGFPRSLGVT